MSAVVRRLLVYALEFAALFCLGYGLGLLLPHTLVWALYGLAMVVAAAAYLTGFNVRIRYRRG